MTARFLVSSRGRRWLGCALLALALGLLQTAELAAQAPPPESPASEQQLLDQVARAEREHGAASEAVVIALRDLASFYWSEQRLADSIRTNERAVVIARQVSPNGFGLSRLLQNLAAAYTTNHEPQRALPLLQEALAIRERLRGPDHPDVAVVLLNLGDAHRLLGEYDQALPPMRRALAIRENSLGPANADVAWATSYIGRVHREVGDYAGALPYMERTLAIREQALGSTHRFVSRSLSDLALLHRDMGQYDAARPLLERALEIDRGNLGPDHPDLVNALSSLGLLLRDMGEYAAALPLFERALQIDLVSAGPDHPRVASRLTDLGLVYRALGDNAKATTLYERALAIEESQPAALRAAVATRMANLATAYAAAGDPARALGLYERALSVDEAVYGPQHPRIAATLAGMARAQRGLGRIDLALPLAERATQIEKHSGGAMHPRLATALLTSSSVRQAAGDAAAALSDAQRALAIASRGDQPDTLWRAQNALAALAAAAGDAPLAIYWGKQSVNTVQSLRGRLTGLAPELQRAFLTDKRSAYTHLADQLIAAGRLAEAQEVLAMLKEEELYDFTVRSSGDDPRHTRASFVGPAETAAEQRWRDIAAQLAQLGRESAELSRKARLGLSPDEQARRRQVEDDLVLANQRFDQYLAELRRDFAAAGARRAEEFGGRQLQNLVVLQDVLAELGRDTVLLHYVVTDSRVAIIVTTADVQIARETRIASADLNRQVLAFRQALGERRDLRETQKLAQALHRHLIAPVAADLKQAGAKRLMLSLDGTLRYVPFAALHDGRRWLVEDYQLSIYTEAARVQLTRRPQRQWEMTGLGLTRAVPGFAALPAVREELEGVRRSVARGEVFLDEQFTAERLRDELADAPPVLHIASHFQFRPGTLDRSFLLLGDGNRLTLKDIGDRRLRFSGIDLLTLSACDTAMGGSADETGAEVEGFGALAQRQGASAVLATLWPVADGSTGRFMQLVYAGRQADARLPKGDALRRAQLAFLRGDAGGKTRDPKLAHPFYWAPYVLMGNWL